MFTRGSSQKTLAEVGHSGRSISIREHILLTHADTGKHFTLAMRSTKPSFLKEHHRHLRSRRSVQALAAQSAAPISTALPTRSPKTPSTVARLQLPQLQICELPCARPHDRSPDDMSINSQGLWPVACGLWPLVSTPVACGRTVRPHLLAHMRVVRREQRQENRKDQDEQRARRAVVSTCRSGQPPS